MDITTPRLHLRPLTLADAKAAHEFRRRGEVMQWSMKKTPDKDLAETEAWVSKTLSVPNHVFVVTESQSPSDTIIGTIGLRFMELPFASSEDKPRRWELGYQFHPDVWGKGYATEAARAVVQAWRQGEIGRLEEEGEWAGMLHAATNKENEASQRVLRKLGFERAREFVDPMGTVYVDYKFVG